MIVFIHIPSTGGSTLRSIAFRHYLEENIVDLGNAALDMRAGVSRLADLSNEPEPPLLVWGHVVLARKLLPQDARVFTMLRHPLTRAISHYNRYLRRASDPKWLRGRRARKVWRSERAHEDVDFAALSLDECIAERLFYVPDNVQTRMLAGRWGLENGDSSRLLDLALRNVRANIELAGITERFDESVVLAGRALGWTELDYEPANVGNSPRPDELEPATRAQLERENELDLALYQEVEGLFRSRIEEQGSSFAEDVERLRSAREARA